MAINPYDYKYITGAFSCSNVGKRYQPWGSSTSNYSWSVEFTSVRMSGAGLLASNPDSDDDNWKVGIDSNKHPYVVWRSLNGRNTYTYSNLTVSWNTWFSIKFNIVTNGASPTVRCTLGSSTQDVKCTGRWTYNVDHSLTVGSSASTIRDNVIIKGYPYTNTLATATFALDSMTLGATSVTVDGYTYSCPAIQRYYDPAPTVSASFTYTSATQISLTGTANANCNKWEYKIGSGSWTQYSTTNSTSQSVTLTVSSTSTVYVRATKTSNSMTGEASVSVDRTAPTISSVTVTDASATTVTLKATTNVNCNKWEYRIGSGSWTSFSTSNTTSVSTTVTVSGTGTIYVRVTRTSNLVTATSSGTSYDKTAPTVSSVTASSVGASSFTLSVTTNVNCNKWEYRLTSSSSWVSFSTTNGTSASTTITGLSPATTYSVSVRLTRTSNYVTNTGAVSVTTLGYATITSIVNANTGSTTTLKFTPKASGFYYRVVYKIGSTTLRTDTIGQVNQTTEYTYTVSAFAHSTLPSSNSATVTATLSTYTSNAYTSAVLIGSDSKTFTLTVPSSLAVSATVTLTPVNDNTWLSQNMSSSYVAGYSKVKVTTTATASTGSSISSIAITGAFTGSGTPYTSGVLTAGNKTINVRATDARSRYADASGTITVLAYASPSITGLTALRGTGTGSEWVQSDSGTTIKVTCKLTSSLSPTNKTTIYLSCSGTSVSYANQENGATITHYFTDKSETQTHAVSVYAVDNLTTGAGTTITVATEEVPFSWNKDRIGVGGVPQTARSFEVADGWSFVANGKNNAIPYLPYSFNAYGTSGTAGYVRIATITITGNNISQPIEFDIQRRLDGRTVRLYVLFNSEGNTDPALSSFYYDSYAGTAGNKPEAFILKATTSVWEVYVRKSANSDNVGIYTLMPAHAQDRCNITYSQYQVSSIPSGAVRATPVPPDSTTPTLTKSSGVATLTNANLRRQGSLCIFTIRAVNGSSVTPIATDVWKGTTNVPLPLVPVTGSGYSGASVIMALLGTDGSLNVRVTGEPWQSGYDSSRISLIYFTES